MTTTMTATEATLPGASLPELKKQMVIQTMRSHAWAGRNPVHWNPEFAAREGLAAPAATGRMSSAFLSEMCLLFFGPSFLRGGRIYCRYVRPVHAGDLITVRGTVRDRSVVGDRIRLTVDIWCENDEGVQVTTGWAESDVT